MQSNDGAGRFATFFVTTGRCGTQWLSKNLAAAYPDLAIVTHDPLPDWQYQARELLWSGDVDNLVDPGPIIDHLEKIKGVLAGKNYIETGGFCRGAFPYLLDKLGRDTRVVHLVRHPVATARSYRRVHETLIKEEVRRLWTGESKPALDEKYGSAVEPAPFDQHDRISTVQGLGSSGQTPFDPGSRFHEYRDRWDALSELERELYRWLEINACAVAYEKEARSPWLRVKYEELFTGNGLRNLISFLQLPFRSMLLKQIPLSVDKFSDARTPGDDSVDLTRHPAVLRLMAELEYDPDVSRT
jgi:hypothetical protein